MITTHYETLVNDTPVHTQIVLIIEFNGIGHFKKPIHVELSNPIFTIALTYAACVTKDMLVLIILILF